MLSMLKTLDASWYDHQGFSTAGARQKWRSYQWLLALERLKEIKKNIKKRVYLCSNMRFYPIIVAQHQNNVENPRTIYLETSANTCTR